MTTRVFAILLIFSMLSGCGGSVSPNGDHASLSSGSSSENIKQERSTESESFFTDNELIAFLADRPIDCKYKSGWTKPELKEILIEGGEFDISDIRDLTYSLDSQTNDNIVFAITITGNFIATGTIYDNQDASQITTEPVFFEATAQKVSNGITFSDCSIPDIPFIKPINPPDLENLLQYIDIAKESPVNYAILNPDYPSDNPFNPQMEYIKAGEIDLENPDLRCVVIDEASTDEECLIRFFSVEIYDKDEYICTGDLSYHHADNPRAHLTDLVKLN